MKKSTMRYGALVGALLLLIAAAACSTANLGTAPSPDRDASASFAVSALPGLGSFSPELEVAESDGGVAVTVLARGADELAAAYVHLAYDAAAYTPASIEFGNFLGAEGEVVSLGLTDVADYVPLGIAQIAPSGVAPASGDGELATVRFIKAPFTPVRTTSGSPTGDRNKVKDLKIITQTAATATLQWTEVNTGDYNNDSAVAVSDLTSIGQNFNKTVSGPSDPLYLVDGDKNGVINVSDITPIGQNFGNMITGYILYTDAEGTAPYGSGITIRRDSLPSPDLSHPLVYTYVADLPGGTVNFTVKPAQTGDENNSQTVQSNVAELLDEPGAPQPPTDVTAVSNEATGHKSVMLEWTLSSSIDVASYIIERKLSSADDTAWTEAGSVTSTETSHVDHDDAFVEGENYDYRAKAVDFTELSSDYAVAGPVTPWFAPPPPAPRNVVADNTVHVENAIEVRWDEPADDTDVTQYRVYRQAPGESAFSELVTLSKYQTSHIDSGLTPGENYDYYVVSVDAQDVESVPSDTVGNTPSTYIPDISITGLTTDKTTFNRFGGDGVAGNITVVTDEPATSYVWTASQGTVTGTGATVTWAPPVSAPQGTVQIGVTVYNGTASDTDSLTLYMTDESIKSSLGDGTGHYIDFTAECLVPSVEGGAIIPNRSLSYYATQDHVILLDRFESS